MSNLEDMPYTFQIKVKVNPITGCWYWIASTNGMGYGVYREADVEGKPLGLAHRICYERLVAPVPEGLHLDHMCWRERCVNPQHLEPVTSKENSLRGRRSALAEPKEFCRNGHPYEGNRKPRKDSGGTRCIVCIRESSKRHYARSKNI